MVNQILRRRFIQETEMALNSNMVEIGYTLVKLYKPEFASDAQQELAEQEARSIVMSAVQRWYLEDVEEDEPDGQEVAWTNKPAKGAFGSQETSESSGASWSSGKRPETVETCSPLRSAPSSKVTLTPEVV